MVYFSATCGFDLELLLWLCDLAICLFRYDASFEELEKRKEQNNGNLSANDFNEVFNEIVAKQLKARGYYDDKY